MNSYKINRWDVIILKNNNINKTPMIYIKPDRNLINILNKNDWVLDCKIKNTNKKYDCLENIKIYFKNNTNIPNNRINYFEKTGYISGLLNSEWFGYPNISNLGEIQLQQNIISTDYNLENYPQFNKHASFKDKKINKHVSFADPIVDEINKCSKRVKTDSRYNYLHNLLVLIWIIIIINCITQFIKI